MVLALGGWWLPRAGDGVESERAGITAPVAMGPVAPHAAPSAADASQARGGLSQVHRLWALKAAADRGDAAAMRGIAFTSSRCAGMGHGRRGIQHTLDAVSANLERHSPESAAVYRRAGQRLKVQCDVLAGWSEDLRGLGRAWRDRAAEAGDLPASIRKVMDDGQRDPQAVAALLDRVVISGDAAAMAEMGALLLQASRSGHSLPGYEGLAFDEFDVYAMQMIACERGLACGDGSVLLDEICLTGLECSSTEFPALVRNNVEEEGQLPGLDHALKKMRGLLEG